MVEGSNFIFVGTKSAGNVYAIDKNNVNKVKKSKYNLLKIG